MKTCSKCKEEKELSEFYKNCNTKDGHAFHCKVCASKYQRSHYSQDHVKSHVKAQNKAYKDSHEDQIKAYRDSHKDQIKAYRDSHKDQIKAYRDSHKDQIKAYQTEYVKTDASKSSAIKYKQKYPNATKSRAFYSRNKHKLSIASNCEKCSSTNRVQGHHHDYNLPLDVTYLCGQCHTDWHQINTPLNRVSGIFTEKSH